MASTLASVVSSSSSDGSSSESDGGSESEEVAGTTMAAAMLVRPEPMSYAQEIDAVSYTHLTLPTKRIV